MMVSFSDWLRVSSEYPSSTLAEGEKVDVVKDWKEVGGNRSVGWLAGSTSESWSASMGGSIYTVVFAVGLSW